MSRIAVACIAVLGICGVLALGMSPAIRSTGQTGSSGKTGTDCNSCHFGGLAPVVTLQGPTLLGVGQTATYTLTIMGGQKKGGGLDVANDGGTLIATDANTRVESGELIHNAPFVGDPIPISFDYQAPATPGIFNLFAAGNSVNLNGLTTFDRCATTTLVITVVDPCEVKFTEFGQGFPGSGGFVPHLSGTDGLCAGSYQVHISDALGSAPCFLWAGLGTTTTMLFGGDFYVSFAAPFVILPIPLLGAPGVPGAGFIDLPGLNVQAFAGFTIYLQATIPDPGALRMVSLSNGLEMAIG